MKKLGKLSINLERVMKNEELVNLRGGDYYGYGTCGWTNGSETGCGISKDLALYWVSTKGGRWCCDSCDETEYCGG